MTASSPSAPNNDKSWLWGSLVVVGLAFAIPGAVAFGLFWALRYRAQRRDWGLLTLAGMVGSVLGGPAMLSRYLSWLWGLAFGGDRLAVPVLGIMSYAVLLAGLAGLLAGTSVAQRLPALLRNKPLGNKADILPTESEKSRLDVAKPPTGPTTSHFGGRNKVAPENSFMLGVDKKGAPVYVTGSQMGTHTLLFGSTGSGKSVTIQVIAGGLMDLGWSGMVLDLKEDTKPGGLRDWCKDYAAAHGIPYQELRLSDPNPAFWFNPLAGLGQDEARDTIMTLSDFDDQYYQALSKSVMGQALKLMWWANAIDPISHPLPTMYDIVRFMGSVTQQSGIAAARPLAALVKTHRPEIEVQEEFRVLLKPSPDEANQAKSWAAKLGNLYETQAGVTLLRPSPDGTRPLMDVTQKGITYVGLDSTSKLDLSQVVSAAVLQRISVDAAQRTTGQGGGSVDPRFVIVDEASIVDRDIVQALLSKARSAGVAMVLATQGPKDWMDRDGDDYQKLGQNTNVAMIMSQGEPEAAELCADYIGKQEYQSVTYSHRDGEAVSSGSIREARDHIVSPDDLRRLQVGEMVMRIGKPQEVITWVKVLPRDPTSGGINSSASDGTHSQHPGPDPGGPRIASPPSG